MDELDTIAAKRLYELVRQKMVRDGLSQRKAANEIGVSHSGLSRLKLGHTLSWGGLMLVTSWVGINPHDLLDGGHDESDADLKRWIQDKTIDALMAALEDVRRNRAVDEENWPGPYEGLREELDAGAKFNADVIVDFYAVVPLLSIDKGKRVGRYRMVFKDLAP